MCYQAPSGSDADHSEKCPPSYCYQVMGSRVRSGTPGTRTFPSSSPVFANSVPGEEWLRVDNLILSGACLQLVEFVAGLIDSFHLGYIEKP